MEENKQNTELKENKVNVTGGKIDKETLDIMSQEDILTAISDQKEANRLILNCFMEFLGELHGLRTDLDSLLQVVSVCSKDKILDFFKQVDAGFENEKTRVAVQEKIKESHKKPTKKTNKSAK